MRTTVDLLKSCSVKRRPGLAAVDGLKLADLIARYVALGLEQGWPAGIRYGRSELPVTGPATGRILPAIKNMDVHRILEEEEIAGG